MVVMPAVDVNMPASKIFLDCFKSASAHFTLSDYKLKKGLIASFTSVIFAIAHRKTSFTVDKPYNPPRI